MSRLNAAFFLVLSTLACDRAEAPQSAAQKAQLADARAACTQLMARQRTCTDHFIPALVDVRRELNRPSGIAEAPRAEVIEAALEEWKSDSADSAIAAQCERMAPELSAANVAEGKRCLAHSGCEPFVTCVMPIVRERLGR